MVCELLGGKYQEMALFFYMIIRNLTWMGVFWKSHDWRTFGKSFGQFISFYACNFRRSQNWSNSWLYSIMHLYCFNNLNKISLPKYDRAIVILKKKKRQWINYYSVILCQHGPSFLTLYIDLCCTTAFWWKHKCSLMDAVIIV